MEQLNAETIFETIVTVAEQLETSSYDELLNFVQQNNLDMSCYTNLIECGYTFDKLKYIDKDDLNIIFPNREQTALRSEFRTKLFEWKASQGISTPIYDSQSSTLSWPQSTSTFSWPESSCSTSNYISKGVKEILQSSEIGKEIIKQFNINKYLTEDNRRKIVQIISENFYVPGTASYSTLKLTEIEKLADEIIEIFPTECKDVYYLSRKNNRTSPSGILYNKLHNHHRKRKIVPIPKDNNNEKEDEQTVFSSTILDYVNKLKFYAGSEDDCSELWKATYSYRKHFIKRAVSLESVVEEFPLYKQAMGHKFIEEDFKELYPEKQFILTSKWCEALPKLTAYFEHNVKDKYYKNLLTSAKGEIDINSRDSFYFMLLHTILKPTHRYIIKEGDLKVHRKATIQNSVNSSILHIATINDLQHQIELRTKNSTESKSPIQPFIIVVGLDLLNLTDFYVSFGYHKFKFSSFVVSLDICFKIYQIFSLKYPDESHKVWSFLQHFFTIFRLLMM